MTFLSSTEQQFLNGSRQFTKAQQRYIRCRLKKKLRLLDEESRNAAAALQRRCNGPNNLLPNTIDNERVVGRVGVEPTTPAMSRRYPNQARPPAQYIMKKFVAQIYVVDRLYVGTN
jgi:hypothetical protein